MELPYFYIFFYGWETIITCKKQKIYLKNLRYDRRTIDVQLYSYRIPIEFLISILMFNSATIDVQLFLR
ncbi:MAG: hypothetical protein A2275_09515 [Bacteroidetes bacterium RIFOXYA12_FULL_35_11]|nr:MAG: hypothetical protein A2275_09515 [Bacteroidetes bacterium RIFOXYA12_FULL_35_11]OFY95260.1 MAG: hypothetical protein A2309_03035 [Bacteroidetes bacterium RIFOXYB2_FULL_35_7]HBX52739.1 hypothetical protein [Bacteroidales bacterium]